MGIGVPVFCCKHGISGRHVLQVANQICWAGSRKPTTETNNSGTSARYPGAERGLHKNWQLYSEVEFGVVKGKRE